MIDGRVLPWVQDSNSENYPVWNDFGASQRKVYILNYEGIIETSFDITPYNPSDPDDVLSLTNLILSYREESNNCNTDEVDLWGECYNIQETTNITLAGNPVTGILDLGEIPPQIGNLINLDTLSCTFCGLTGSIPPEIGNLTNLKSLSFLWNGITGSIPPEISNLINLENLTIHSNQLTGSIPPEIGYLENLKYLNLTDNYNLTGVIPSEIGNLNNLIELQIGNHDTFPSQLSGEIPSEIGNLINLEVLFLYHNQFTGSIPIEIGSLTNLHYLRLNNNQFTGQIPSEIENLVNLTYFELGGNQFTGTIPTGIGSLINLSRLGLSANQLTGEFPGEIYNLINLEYLFLYNNQLHGELPTGIESLINLERIDISDNQFTGEFPDGICDLTNITNLDISNNQFCNYPDCFYDYYFGYQDTTNCDTTEYFGPVWHVSNNGSDVNGRGSEASPFASIQKGIDFANAGDTVLINPGVYSTNNAIYDKNIILGSRFLTTGDISFISNTIIDGGGEGCPLMVYGNINDSCRVTGLTIQNGTTGCVYGQGGGIYVEGSNPRLDNLIIKNNRSTNFGGGMHIVSSPTIENIIIKNNQADELGGGLYIATGSSPIINNLQIIGNSAVHGGGIFMSENEQVTINNTLIAENYQLSENIDNPILTYDGYGAIEINGSNILLDGCTIANNHNTGIFLRDGSNMILSNSIYWFNDSIMVDNALADTISISYSNVENSLDGIGNISIDPLFCNLFNGDYTLATNSPCISVGQNSSNMGALGIGCEEQNNSWNFSISEPIIQVDGSDDEWNPGESLSLEMEFCNNSSIGHMFYPGVVLEADTTIVAISNNYFWFYGMDANSCNVVTFEITADSSIISDTLVTFIAYSEALNCENQPEYCIIGDTTIFHIEIAGQGVLNTEDSYCPLEISLHQNYPNPFNPITSIRYDLPNDDFVNIAVYDMKGRLVKTLINSRESSGSKSILWDATNDKNEHVSAGLYIYAIQVGNLRQTKKMVLLK